MEREVNARSLPAVVSSKGLPQPVFVALSADEASSL
jgi:hypothetical protein